MGLIALTKKSRVNSLSSISNGIQLKINLILIYNWNSGKQFTLEHKLDEIVCSMGVNSSYLPATTETTSPICKFPSNFNWYNLLNIYFFIF